jgi:hypothetical protein
MSSNDKICIISANNSLTSTGETLDYMQLASIAANRVRYYLGLSTYLITSDIEISKKYSNFAGVIEYIPQKISKRSVIAGKEIIQYEWFNDSRIDVFHLTKNIASKVLMIDADYMIASDQLGVWLNNDYPFTMFNVANDIINSNIYAAKYFPSNDIPQRWATAICWDNSAEAEIIFKTAKMVRDNYEFYAAMLGMPKTPFRNDVAFSVACHLHNIPYSNYQQLWNLPPAGKIYNNRNKNSWVACFNNECLLWDNDIHILNKEYAINLELMNELRLTNVPA